MIISTGAVKMYELFLQQHAVTVFSWLPFRVASGLRAVYLKEIPDLETN